MRAVWLLNAIGIGIVMLVRELLVIHWDSVCKGGQKENLKKSALNRATKICF